MTLYLSLHCKSAGDYRWCGFSIKQTTAKGAWHLLDVDGSYLGNYGTLEYARIKLSKIVEDRLSIKEDVVKKLKETTERNAQLVWQLKEIDEILHMREKEISLARAPISKEAS